jgi:small subunit ribosomal protein S3Ae
LAVKKAKSKEWFTLVAPKIFGGKEVGRTMTDDPKRLVNRRIIVSPIEVTNNFGKYYMKLSFRVNELNGNRAMTVFDGSECMRDYISRMVLRHVRRVDAVQDLTTKDGAKIRVKTIAVITRKVKSSIQKDIRAKMKGLVADFVSNSTLEETMAEILADNVKNSVMQELRHIYPIRNFEFRKTEILK